MQTFDNTRPVVAAMAIGVGKAALDRTWEILGKHGIKPNHKKNFHSLTQLEATCCALKPTGKPHVY